jgi:6-phosphogluconolactonase (cycloisomerase 2 family)
VAAIVGPGGGYGAGGDLFRGLTKNGKTSFGSKNGGYDQAQLDFQSLNPQNIKVDPKNGTIYGTLTNGDKVNVRSYSTDAGKPTLEIQHNNGQVTKIRYDN